MKDQELFDLCKQVYEATGWECNGNQYLRKGHYFDSEGNEYQPGEPYLVWFASKYDRDFPEEWLCPLYTSDYLLEKLPPVVQDFSDKIFRHIQMWVNGDSSTHAGYVEPYAHDDKVAYAQSSDVMKKTLLKLTLALHKEGLLS